MPLSLDEFIARLLAAGLMTQPQLTEFLSSLPSDHQPRNGEQLAQRLVQRQLLTPYQAESVYSGQTQHLVLGNYLVLDKLGQGGMGLVLKALHRRMDRVVALKILSPDAVKTPAFIERFHREAKAAAKLEHLNIVTAFDADEAHGVHFLVMQYVDGENLAALARRQGPLPISRAIDCVIQAARGLEYAHRHGVIHRDIKPANLLLQREGTVKILDMGLARIEPLGGEPSAESGLTDTGAVMGTVDYMSPEQALNSKLADARSDQYSLGITLFYLLTGKPAYSGGTTMEKLIAHREAPLPSLTQVLLAGKADVPVREHLETLDAILHQMIAKQPEQRFASMTEVLAALNAVQTSLINEPTLLIVPPALAAASTTADPHDLRQANLAAQSRPASPLSWSADDSPANGPANTLTSPGSRADTDTRAIRRPVPAVQSRPRRHVLTAFSLAVAATALAAWYAVAWLNQKNHAPRENQPLPRLSGAPNSSSALVRGNWQGWPADAPAPAIAPFDTQQAKTLQTSWANYLGVPVEFENSLGMKFALIPPGEFLRGTAASEIEQLRQERPGEDEARRYWRECVDSEGPQHPVVLTQPFYLGVTEVTQGQYYAITATTPSSFPTAAVEPANAPEVARAGLPVESISWHNAVEFCNQLSRLEHLQAEEAGNTESVVGGDSGGYRLPSEAEWEFACRAGTTTRFWPGDHDLGSVAWFSDNSNGQTHPVGGLPANPWGLYDVHGNVWEWCAGEWSPQEYAEFRHRTAIDPRRSAEGEALRPVRGGGWGKGPLDNRASFRFGQYPHIMPMDVGFRVALPVGPVRRISWQKSLAAGKSVDLIPLVKPTILGDGRFSNVLIQEGNLTLDASSADSPNLWLDFRSVRGQDFTIRALLKIDDPRNQGFAKFVFVSDKPPAEHYAILANDGRHVRAWLDPSADAGSLDNVVPLPLSVNGPAIEVAYSVIGTRRQLWINRRLALEAPRPDRYSSYAALAANGWKVSFERPEVILPQPRDSDVPP